MDLIIQKEREILKLTENLNKSKSKSSRDKIQKQINSIRFEQDTIIMTFLENSNDEYIEKLNLNFDLLENDNITLAVSQEGGNPITYYETELHGEIHSNGYLYFKATKTNRFFDFFSSIQYPTKFAGVINYFGEASVRAIKTDFSFWGSRVPQKFKGAIEKDGNVNFETSNSYWEPDGHAFIKKIIADPFSGNQIKREKFITGRIELRRIMNEFKTKTLSGL